MFGNMSSAILLGPKVVEQQHSKTQGGRGSEGLKILSWLKYFKKKCLTFYPLSYSRVKETNTKSHNKDQQSNKSK